MVNRHSTDIDNESFRGTKRNSSHRAPLKSIAVQCCARGGGRASADPTGTWGGPYLCTHAARSRIAATSLFLWIVGVVHDLPLAARILVFVKMHAEERQLPQPSQRAGAVHCPTGREGMSHRHRLRLRTSSIRSSMNCPAPRMCSSHLIHTTTEMNKIVMYGEIYGVFFFLTPGRRWFASRLSELFVPRVGGCAAYWAPPRQRPYTARQAYTYHFTMTPTPSLETLGHFTSQRTYPRPKACSDLREG